MERANAVSSDQVNKLSAAFRTNGSRWWTSATGLTKASNVQAASLLSLTAQLTDGGEGAKKFTVVLTTSKTAGGVDVHTTDARRKS